MNDKQRRTVVWLKYNKHCAYCGTKIRYEDLEVDHREARSKGGKDSKANYNPSCFTCNHYKKNHSLEQFRTLLKHLTARIDDYYLVKVARKFGMVDTEPWDGIFYFEKFK